MFFVKLSSSEKSYFLIKAFVLFSLFSKFSSNNVGFERYKSMRFVVIWKRNILSLLGVGLFSIFKVLRRRYFNYTSSINRSSIGSFRELLWHEKVAIRIMSFYTWDHTDIKYELFQLFFINRQNMLSDAASWCTLFVWKWFMSTTTSSF